MPKAELAGLLALAAAYASALGNVARQRSAHEVTEGRVGYLALFFMSWRNRDWRLGAVAAVANYGLQAAALSLGSVILVTGLQVTALLFALPLYARMTVGREWTYKGKTLSFANAGCPDGRLQAKVQAKFKDGTFLQGSVFKTCKGR